MDSWSTPSILWRMAELCRVRPALKWRVVVYRSETPLPHWRGHSRQKPSKDPQVHFLTSSLILPHPPPTPAALKEGHSNPLFALRSNVRNLLGLPVGWSRCFPKEKKGRPTLESSKERSPLGEWDAWGRIITPLKYRDSWGLEGHSWYGGTGSLHLETLLCCALRALANHSPTSISPSIKWMIKKFLNKIKINKKSDDIIFQFKLYLTVILKLGVWGNGQKRKKTPYNPDIRK